MRILQAFDIFSPHTNGTVKLLYQLSKALMQRGHEVAVYTSDFKFDQEYTNSLQGARVYPFHLCFDSFALYLTPGIVVEAKRKLKDFDIIHLHSCRSFQNIVIHHYAKKYSVPYVVDAHGSTPRRAGGKRGLKWLLRWLFDVTFGCDILRDASRVIAETEVGVNEYKELGVSQNKIVLLPPPFDIEQFSKLPPAGVFRSKYNLEDMHIILFLGRIHWIKGIDFLVESFYELTRYRNDSVLVIVGYDDGYKSTLEKLINKLNLSSRVLFTGFLNGEEKLSALVDADLFVQPSRYEQGAWAPLEAILCNTPIIVTKHTGSGEDVRKIDAGYLVEFGNKSDLRDKMQYILDNQKEASIKTKKAKEHIKMNRSMVKRIVEYEKLYAKCIEENTRILVRKR